jgi:hypothetical protein
MATTKRGRKIETATKKRKGSIARGRSAPSPTSPQERKSGASSTLQEGERRRLGEHAAKRQATASLQTGRHETSGAAVAFRDGTKGSTIVSLLMLKGGATIADLTKATGWQVHSVRGFLSGALKKKAGLTIASEKGDDGERRYRIAS